VTGHWALAAAGSWSILLAVLILSPTHAVTHSPVNTVGVGPREGRGDPQPTASLAHHQ